MKQIDTKDLERIISLYLDDELEFEEKQKFEVFLANNPLIARDVEILRAAKNTLSAKQKIPANDWFWLKLSNTIETKDSGKTTLLTSARPQFALAMAGIFTVFVVGMLYFKDAALFHKFFNDKKN